MKTNDPYLPLAKVDSTVHKKVAEKFGVKGFPTLKFFHNGKDSEYGGGRTKDTIISWLKKKSGPPSALFASAEEVEKFKEANNVAVVFLGEQGSPEFEVYESVARDSEDVLFGHSFSSEVASSLNAEAPVVILFKKFDEGRNDYK